MMCWSRVLDLDDITGIGVAHIIFSDMLPGFTKETDLELFYKIQLTPYVVLQPDVHFISNPGGEGQYRDAIVGGLRFEFLL